MKFHTEIKHPDDPPTYKERTVTRPRSPQHAALMDKQDREIRLEYLRKKKRLFIP